MTVAPDARRLGARLTFRSLRVRMAAAARDRCRGARRRSSSMIGGSDLCRIGGGHKDGLPLFRDWSRDVLRSGQPVASQRGHPVDPGELRPASRRESHHVPWLTTSLPSKSSSTDPSHSKTGVSQPGPLEKSQTTAPLVLHGLARRAEGRAIAPSYTIVTP